MDSCRVIRINAYDLFVDKIPCMISMNELVDMHEFGKGSESTLFVRLAQFEYGPLIQNEQDE